MLGQLGDIALIVAPVFALVAIGYLASVFGLLKDRAADGLSEYVFSVGVPVLIFKTLADAKLPEGGQPWGYWIAYFAGAFACFAIAMMLARRVFGRSHIESVVYGFSAGQANTVFVGVPLILQAFGPEGAVPLFLLIAVHLPIMMVAATVLAEGGGLSRAAVARLGKALAFNPILIGIYVGAAFRLFNLPFSGPPAHVADMIAASAVPCALISLGLALRRYPIGGDISLTLVITSLKLLVHPLLVLLLTLVLPMPPVWAGVAVAFAAMPCGVNAYLLAQRYDAGVAASASAVSLSTGLSLFTVTMWFYILGVG